jgi:hypothetical protein
MTPLHILLIILGIILFFVLVSFLFKKVIAPKKEEEDEIPPEIPTTINPDWPNADEKIYFGNYTQHKTKDYRFPLETPTIVARRGFPIVLMLKDLDKEELEAIRSMPRTIQVENTVAGLEFTIQKVTSSYVVLTTPVTAKIGNGILKIGTFEFDVYLIFNPYHPRDATYMDLKTDDGDDLRDEYVQNELGIVFAGDGPGQGWNFQQFAPEVLTAIMRLFDNKFWKYWSRHTGTMKRYKYQLDATIGQNVDFSDPGQVARLCTFLVNNNLVSGNWAKVKERIFDATPKPCTVDKEPAFLYASKDCEGNGDLVQCLEPGARGTWDNITNEDPSKPADPFFSTVCALQSKNKRVNLYNDTVCTNDSDCSGIDRNTFNTWRDGTYSGYSEILPYFNDTLSCVYDDKRFCGQGIDPDEWRQAADFMKVWYAQKRLTGVYYGQCWVFAAVLNSCMRALGIPSRVLTNISSNHPQVSNLIPLGMMPKDSGYSNMAPFKPEAITYTFEGNQYMQTISGGFWNFHVWNDIWLRRDDLKGTPYEKAGWQAIDATPQEPSFGPKQMGPAPLAAVKNMDTSVMPFDVRFVSSEVNFIQISATKAQLEKAKKLGLAESNAEPIPGQLPGPGGNPVTAKPLLGDKYKDGLDRSITQVSAASDYKPHPPTNALRAFLRSLTPGVFIQAEMVMIGDDVKLEGYFFSPLAGTIEFDVNILETDYRAVPKSMTPVLTYHDAFHVGADETFEYHRMLPGIKFVGSEFYKIYISARYPDGSVYVDNATVQMLMPTIKLTVESCCSIRKGDSKMMEISFTNPLKSIPVVGKLVVQCEELHLYKSMDVALKPRQTVVFNERITAHDVHPVLRKTLIQASLMSNAFPTTITGSQAIYVIQ